MRKSKIVFSLISTLQLLSINLIVLDKNVLINNKNINFEGKFNDKNLGLFQSKSNDIKYNFKSNFKSTNFSNTKRLSVYANSKWAWDGDVEKWGSIDEEFFSNLKEIFKKIYIGDYDEIIQRYDYIDKTRLSFNSVDSDLVEWSCGGNSGKRTLFKVDEKDEFPSILLSKNDTYNIHKYVSDDHWNESTSGKGDFAKIKYSYKVLFDARKCELKIISYNRLGARDEYGKGWSYAESILEFKRNNTNVGYYITPSYTQYDINNFNQLFKNTLCDPIILDNVTDPVIFSYDGNGENERKVFEIFEQRKKKFYNNYQIVNKLGTISKPSNNNDEYDYVVDDRFSDIELLNIDQCRGKSGAQTIKVRFYLKQGRVFNFNNDGFKPYFDADLIVKPRYSPDIDFNIDELVTVTPYISSSNTTKDNYVENNDLRISLSRNYPNPNELSNFSLNINEKNSLGENNIIPIEKFPIISKVGTSISLDLEIVLENTILNRTISFDRTFTTGKIYATLDLSGSDYDSSSIKIKNNKIVLGIQIVDNQVILSNEEPIELENNIDSNVELNLVGSLVSLPTEQNPKDSKWVRIKDEQIFQSNDGSQIRYVGSFKTFDPFHFKLNTTKIPIYDPITGEPLGYASRYKPFIREGSFDENNPDKTDGNDLPIFSKPETINSNATFNVDLGSYVMKRKTENGKYNFQIVIKEYDSKSEDEDKYSKTRWILEVEMNLLNSKSTFNMIGYKDNEIIKQENELRYFNDESPYYRGNFASEDTGMYIPKIVWVNANPPESFMYDPKDEQGNLIVPKNPTIEQMNNAKYDVGYIAELNATAFTSNDYKSISTFGGYETIFNEEEFKPTGLIPYSESYTYNENNVIPEIERKQLTNSGLLDIDSTIDFRQVVLKRPDSDNYLYQFVKISKELDGSESSEVTKYGSDIIGLYGDRKGLKNKPLFVDFWDTYQGQHLMDYLIKDNQLFSDEDEVKALDYVDVLQYWNIYVNDPENYNSSDIEVKDYDISKIDLGYETIALMNKVDIKRKVIEIITERLNDNLINNGWISSTSSLEYNTHFTIEDTQKVFDAKVSELFDNYDKPLDQAQIITFNIKILDKVFENENIKLNGQTTINILNNKYIDQIIDLSKYGNNSLLINTNDKDYFDHSNLVDSVKECIMNSIDRDFQKIISESEFLSSGFFPQLNKDYKLTFYTKYYENGVEQTKQYSTIEKAIENVLLYNTDRFEFDNNLFIKVEAIFNNDSHFMKNSFTKLVNNNQDNKNVDLDAFDLSTINNSTLKINSESKEFEDYQINNRSLSIDEKAQKIYDIAIKKANELINIYSRNWSNTYEKYLSENVNYEFKFIKDVIDNKVIYYDDPILAIKQVLLENLESNFDRNLQLEISSINSDSNTLCKGKFIITIKNNYLNKCVDDDNVDDSIKDDNNNNNIINNNSSISELNNNKGESKSLELWWILTPISILLVIIIGLIVTYKIRKNRKIR